MAENDTPDAEPENEPEPDADAPDDETRGPRWRWKWLSTLASTTTIVVFTALVALDAWGWAPVDLGSLNAYVLAVFVLAYLGSLGYAIGTDTLKEVSELLDRP